MFDNLSNRLQTTLKRLRGEGRLTEANMSEALREVRMALLEAEMPKHPYHNLDHILDVLKAAVLIAENENVSADEIKLLRLAAFFHDAGFIHSPNNPALPDGQAGGHEERGVQMAREILPSYGLQTEQIEQISKMILATKVPQSPATHLEKILCDADLDYLGRDDFYEISNNLFLEMQQQGVVESEREWNIMQRSFLQSHKYHTAFSQTNREAIKQEKLLEIVERLKKK